MKKVFRTESGSIYVIDLATLRWTRSSDHEVIGVPGIEGETLVKLPEIVVGQRVLLLSPSGTWVSTSKVKEHWLE